VTARVVVAGAVRHSPLVVGEFLNGLERLDRDGPEVKTMLVDATPGATAAAPLAAFAAVQGPAALGPPDVPATADGPAPDAQVWHGAAVKNALLAEAFALPETTHVLLVETNLVLPPPLVAHLVGLGKDIVAEVYWTEWSPGDGPMPSVWQSDEYSMSPAGLARATREARTAAAQGFLHQLHLPGTYEVGGLTGCVLIARAAFAAGATYKRVPNVSFWGEDRHFCIRASALGYSLWADTHMAPLHIYGDEDAGRALHFWSRWRPERRAA
jgi:hypothetical protein